MGFRVETDVMVAMRDGVTLATDVWIPDGDEPGPALLVRLPYGKNVVPTMGYFPSTPNLVQAGYGVVWQDCRGMYGSNGEFRPLVDEPTDGADTIAWIREQSWCDGTVGMYGPSYLGFVQWAVATDGVEGLRAIAPTTSSGDVYLEPWYSPGGAVSWRTTWMWSVQQGLQLAGKAGRFESMAQLVTVLADAQVHLAHLPLTDHPAVHDEATWLRDFLQHPSRDEFWEDMTHLERVDDVAMPVLQVAGWFDLFLGNGLRSFVRLRNEGPQALRDEHRLVIGPWDHLNTDGVYPERDCGLSAGAYAADLAGTHLRFFDRHLRGNAAADTGAPVRIFVMGIDQWRDEQDWPLPDTTYVDYFLESGRANTLEGDGALSTQPPTSDAADTIVYDPADPVPTLGGRIIAPVGAGAVGPVDQTTVQRRRDVLCFTTPVFEDPVEVTGPITLVLHVTSTALDTDFTGKLVDVFPDGRALYLTDGILRARYRSSLREPELLEPGQTYELTLDLGATSNVFLPGHALRLEVSSSNFPRYDRNTNTGGVIAEDGPEDLVVATNRVLHGPSHPSRLVLPTIHR